MTDELLTMGTVWLLSTLGLFLFNGLESALVALGKLEPRRRGPEAAGGPGEDPLFEHPRRVLALLLAGATATLTASIVSATVFWSSLSGGNGWAVAAATLVVTLPLLFLAGETLPRAFFRKHAAWAFGWFRRPLRMLYWPFSKLVDGLAWMGVIGPASEGISRLDLLRATREELQQLLRRESEAGSVTGTGHRILSRIVEMRQDTVQQVMQPRARFVSCPDGTDAAGLAQIVEQSGFTRIPVWRETPWHIAGIVHAADLLPASGGATRSVAELLREPLRVAPETSLLDMLRRFQASRQHMAIVETSPGNAVGLLTAEDVLERIIGDIRDEHDPKQPGIRQLFAGTYLVDAVLDLQTVNRHLELNLPSGDYDTLSGFLLKQFRKIPSTGDETSHDGVLFFVTKADGKRVEQVIVKRPSVRGKG
jgi:CBS domain containing-hemolysin-like protein